MAKRDNTKNKLTLSALQCRVLPPGESQYSCWFVAKVSRNRFLIILLLCKNRSNITLSCSMLLGRGFRISDKGLGFWLKLGRDIGLMLGLGLGPASMNEVESNLVKDDKRDYIIKPVISKMK